MCFRPMQRNRYRPSLGSSSFVYLGNHEFRVEDEAVESFVT